MSSAHNSASVGDLKMDNCEQFGDDTFGTDENADDPNLLICGSLEKTTAPAQPNNDDYSYNHAKLLDLTCRVEKLNKYDRLHILRVLYTQTPNLLTENQNGNFINLCDVPNKVVDELFRLVVLFEAQNTELQKKY